MSEPTFFHEGNEPRRTDTQWKIGLKILGALRDTLVAGGLAAGAGTNFRFEGDAPNQVFQIKNQDDGLYHRVDAAQPTPNQVLELEDGTV